MTTLQFASREGLNRIKSRLDIIEQTLAELGPDVANHASLLDDQTETLDLHHTRLNSLEGWRTGTDVQLQNHSNFLSALNVIQMDHEGRINVLHSDTQDLISREAELRNRVNYIESRLGILPDDWQNNPDPGGGSGFGGRREYLSTVPPNGYPSWLQDGEEILIELNTYPSVWVLRVNTFIPMRLRLYGSSAEALADQSRPEGTTPPPESGCALDVQTTPDHLTINCAQKPLCSNNDDQDGNPIRNKLYLLMKNTSGSANYGSADFIILPAERKQVVSDI